MNKKIDKKYVLLGSCDRVFNTPIIYDSLDEARSAMKKKLISAMDGKDDTIFNEYKQGEDYSWSENGTDAWFNYRHGNSDWQIIEFDEILRWYGVPDPDEENDDTPDTPSESGTQNNASKPNTPDNPNTLKSHKILAVFNINVEQEDIDDIMCAALEGGINDWCTDVEVIGEYLGSYGHEQISRGGTLKLYDSEEDTHHELTLTKFLKGLRLFYSKYSNRAPIEGSRFDVGEFDAECADMVVQLALFDDVVYG